MQAFQCKHFNASMSMQAHPRVFATGVVVEVPFSRCRFVGQPEVFWRGPVLPFDLVLIHPVLEPACCHQRRNLTQVLQSQFSFFCNSSWTDLAGENRHATRHNLIDDRCILYDARLVDSTEDECYFCWLMLIAYVVLFLLFGFMQCNGPLPWHATTIVVQGNAHECASMVPLQPKAPTPAAAVDQLGITHCNGITNSN